MADDGVAAHGPRWRTGCTCFIVRANHVAAEGRRSGPRVNSPATIRMSHSAPPMPNTGFNLWAPAARCAAGGTDRARPRAHSRPLRSSVDRPPQIPENSGPRKGHARDTPVMTGQQWPIALAAASQRRRAGPRPAPSGRTPSSAFPGRRPNPATAHDHRCDRETNCHPPCGTPTLRWSSLR